MAKAKVKKAAKVKKESVAAGGGVVKADYAERYRVHDPEARTTSGRKAVDVGDAVAEALRGMDRDAVFEACKANDVEINPKWKDLNPGLGRMAAGNALRGIYRRTGKVKVGTRWVRNPGHVEKEAA